MFGLEIRNLVVFFLVYLLGKKIKIVMSSLKSWEILIIPFVGLSGWDLNGSGSFRVSDVRNFLDDFFLPKDDRGTRWVKSIPIKINVFAWRVSLDRLPSRVNLIRRGIQVPCPDCPICTAVDEDISHLLFRCPMASDINRLICRWTSLKTTPSVGKKNVSILETGNKAFTSSEQKEGQRSTPRVERINAFEKQPLEWKCVLVDDKGKPLKKADYSSNQGSEDEVGSVDNEMTSYSASKSPGVEYATKSLLE
nr:hypothetical protein [Tanacetum cinerariifolium]